MTDFDREALVSTAWLAENLSAPDIRVVDGTYFLPLEEKDAREGFEAAHIPGAVFFDIDDVCDKKNPLPHMLPEPHVFSSKVRKLGLGDGLRIVVYDQRGIFSAARVWWTFRTFGHTDIAVLDGGLPKWLAEGRETDFGAASPGERHFTARVNSMLVRDKEQMLANTKDRAEQVLDARDPARFEGSAPELRPGLRSGHIPGSRNLPFTALLDPDTKTLLAPNALRQKIEASGIDLTKPVTATCGSGVTASVLALALHRVGHRDYAVYDGSWSEWGLPGPTPVESGPAKA